ncbi:MAG TPA: glycosyltransferase, partial [Phycisphaerae bacterium]|nr:glycosyltransferase [Phycisphaerae bacterium]
MTTNRWRVLFVVDAFPDARNPTDGVFLRDQAAALRRHADVGVVLPRTVSPRQWIARRARPLRDRRSEDGGVVVFVNESFVPTARATGRLIRARCRSLERAVRAFGRPDVIHAHGAAFAGETAVCVGRALDVPVVITEHYSFLPRLFTAYGDRLRRVYEAADVVCAPSHSQACRLAELGVARAVRCLPNAVDADTFAFRPVAPPAGGTWRLLCVARDHEVKDLPTLIEAAARLRGVPFELCIAGGGEYRRARTLAALRGLDGRVRFLGALTRDELADAMHACHLVVSSSRIETFGLSL